MLMHRYEVKNRLIRLLEVRFLGREGDLLPLIRLHRDRSH